VKPITVSIVEDKATVSSSLERMIGGSVHCRCVSTSRNGAHALPAIMQHRPEVVIMDINLPDISGIECTARLKQLLPEIQILILTVYNDNRQIFSALEAGANGYLLKRSTPEEIIRAICDVKAGGAPMSAEIARQVVQSFRKPVSHSQEVQTLTPRETEILGLIARGDASKEIADKLAVSHATICTHLGHIYDKLHVRSRTAAAAKYFENTRRG
jgi:DNA-binding NarL/FixJ family response regulator